MKETVMLSSLARTSPNAPWRVGIYIDEHYTYIQVGEKGNVAASPRFFLFLKEIEKNISRYPVDISFHHLTDHRDASITRVKNKVVYIDCGFSSNRLISQARFTYQKEIMGSPLMSSLGTSTPLSESLFQIMKNEDPVQRYVGSNLDYVAICSLDAVTDGDTIDVTIQESSELLQDFGLVAKSKITIRYNGVDTPEKMPDSSDENYEESRKYKDPKNANFGKLYGVTMDDMYEVGNEAAEYNKTLLGFNPNSAINPFVIINFNRKEQGEEPLEDAGYGRFVADIYATSERNASVLMDKMKQGQSFIHVNKTLLVTHSKGEKTSHVPLGIYQYQYAVKDDSVLSVLSWATELDLTPMDTGSGTSPGMPGSAIDPDIPQEQVEPNPTNLDTDTLVFGENESTKSNNHDFFPPYDDRIAEFLSGITTQEDLTRHSKVRIGDCILTIPPVSIEINKTANINKVKTLRTKSSVMVNRGQSLTTLSVDLYFHDLESINGRTIPWKKEVKEGEETGDFYVDGLRPLLAQFAKAPFLPVDNYYINEILGIQDVALLDVEVNTVPNFPESLAARITLVEFNSEAYFMDHSSLNQSINYPMLRWYYNQSMAKRNDKYRYFKGLDQPLSNHISFTLADEEYLQERMDAIEWLKNKDSPEKMRIDMKKNIAYTQKKSDASQVKKIISQYENYKKLYQEADTWYDKVFDTKEGIGYYREPLRNALKTFYKGLTEDQLDNILDAAPEYWNEMYDGKYKNELIGLKRMFSENVFLPYESRPFYRFRFDGEKEDTQALYDENLINWGTFPFLNERAGKGILIIQKFESQQNQDLFHQTYGALFWDEKNERFVLPAFTEAIELLRTIANGAKDMLKSVDEYEERFEDVMRIIEASELGTPMDTYEIRGELTPISIQARFSNQFSMAHVIAGEAPTLQFLGGGDPSLDLVIEMDEQATQDFSRLLAISDDYAKRYSQGITNGYIGIQNDLAQLFGIQYVMFENVKISTVPGFPDRYQLVIHAISFDKTQRQREELKAIPGNTKNMDMEMLKNNKFAYANDRLMQARLRNLEVYPDLELPTYAQLNQALKVIDAQCTEYKNLSGGLYVDPDFYFSTTSTFRKEIEELYAGNHRVNMFDAAGVAAYSSSADAERLFNTTEEEWGKLDELQQTDGVEPLNWVFSWKKNDSDDAPVDDTSGPKLSDSLGKLSVGNEKVQAWLEEKNTDGTPAYNNFPTEAGWQYLFGTEYDYASFKENPNPTEIDVYKLIKKLVEQHFSSYYGFSKMIEDCKGDIDNAEKGPRRVSYVTAEELYSVVFEFHSKIRAGHNYDSVITDLPRETIVKINTLIAEGKMKKPKAASSISTSDYIDAGTKPTKERFMTLMKAFLDKTSSWTHYKNDKFLLSGVGRVGIAQVDITSKDMSVDEAKRLLYNWEYNIKTAFKQLAEHYKKFLQLNDSCDNFEVFCRPYDAMFALYDKPTASITTAEHIENSDVASGVLTRFNHYAFKPFNTYSGYNQEVYSLILNLEKEDKVALGKAKPDEYIDILLNLEYYDKSILKKNNLTVDSELKNIKKAMKEYLETLSVQQLYTLFAGHIKMLYDMYITGGTLGDVFTNPGYIEDKNGYKYALSIVKQCVPYYESLKNVNEAIQDSQKDSDTRLYNDVDPHQIYQEMFYDMRTYDQRGRMIRAFPGFQMFILHEGDWIGKYKFWDNMYGFNAIQSIDVYRSRKIAADTAVISMTNVYSNLTTRRTDVDFVDREMKWWDNIIWNEPPQDLIDKKENEYHRNIFLETGARIHLRMGYGSNASDLPVIFNGTITEVEIGDLIDVVAQGDGLELGNYISGDPDDSNDGLFFVTEPRDLICSMMSSKGSWFKDFMNGATDGQLFRNNPLGIMHFGQPWNTESDTNVRPLGNLQWYNDEYGEVAQNIYSSNGSPTYSQWIHPNGERNNILSDFTWQNFWKNKFKIFNPGDEPNVVIKFYNNTTWDIIQIITLCSPDYIAAVHPFELRSTLFFGKPYWRCAFSYGSTYEYDVNAGTWARHLQSEVRRPYMQHKFYSAQYDIIKNDIRASEEDVFTNVIVNYDGNQTPVLYADADIRFDKQKTRVVEADIVAKFGDFYTSEVMATHYGCSALRDNLKDMYKGSLLVLGDPTVKPHDMMFIGDNINDLHGNCLVKAVTHHFSAETGFVTSIEPDLLVVNDDVVILEISKWFYGFASSFFASKLTQYVAKKGVRNLFGWLMKSKYLPKSLGEWISTKGLRHTVKFSKGNLQSKEWDTILDTLDEIIAEKDPTKIKTLQARLATEFEVASKNVPKATGRLGTGTVKDISRKGLLKSGMLLAKALSKGDDIAKVVTKLVTTIRGVAAFTPIGFIVDMAFWIGSEMLFEQYRRYKENLQCVQAIPLTYRGKDLTAGINNHAGMVYGENPGRYDKLFDATWGKDDGEAEEIFGNFLIEAANFFTAGGGQYADVEKTKALDALSQAGDTPPTPTPSSGSGGTGT